MFSLNDHIGLPTLSIYSQNWINDGVYNMSLRSDLVVAHTPVIIPKQNPCYD